MNVCISTGWFMWFYVCILYYQLTQHISRQYLYTPRRFLTLPGGSEIEHWLEIGLKQNLHSCTLKIHSYDIMINVYYIT